MFPVGPSKVTPIGSAQALIVSKTFMSLVRTLDIVLLLKLTTNIVDPSEEIAKLRAA